MCRIKFSLVGTIRKTFSLAQWERSRGENSENHETGEMAQQGKHWPRKHEDLSSDLQTPDSARRGSMNLKSRHSYSKMDIGESRKCSGQ